MICSVAVSLKRRCSRKWNRKTSASSHTRWYSSYPTSSRFLSVCAVANHRASRLRVFPSPGFALPKGVALSVVAAAFSSGKLILPGYLGLCKWRSCTAASAFVCPTQSHRLKRKSHHPVDDGSILRMACHGLPNPCSANTRFACAATPSWEQRHRLAKPEHYEHSNRRAKD